MNLLDVVILIPALNPGEGLKNLIHELRELGFSRIVTVNDGSDEEHVHIFSELESLGYKVVHHCLNRGKGAAIKTGIKAALQEWNDFEGLVTADADGQHLPEDIRLVADTLVQHPDSLVLGVRDFDRNNVPWRNRMGNRITTWFYKVSNGIDCPDTQTGLRGIPLNLMDLALNEEGSRYEYEMNFLMDAAQRVPMKYVKIQTVYDDNESSHFRPVKDSVLVYERFLRFTLSSLSGAAADYLLFCLLLYLGNRWGGASGSSLVFLSSVLARMGSGGVNFLLNRRWSFQSRMKAGGEAIRYAILFVGQMLVSSGLVTAISLTVIPSVIAKLVVDTMLFFVSYRIQKNWVFRQEELTDEKQ